MSGIKLQAGQQLMSAGELRFIEPHLERACFMCGRKGDWSRRKKHLHCNACHTDFAPMPDGSLLVASRRHAA